MGNIPSVIQRAQAKCRDTARYRITAPGMNAGEKGTDPRGCGAKARSEPIPAKSN